MNSLTIHTIFSTLIAVSLEANYSVDMQLSKKNLYLKEPIDISIVVNNDKNSTIYKTDFDELIIPNFWVKEKDSNKSQYNFTIYPQIAGRLVIPPQLLRVAQREKKTNLILWKDSYTPQKIIEVKPLPKGIDIVGEYKIDLKVDSRTINSNKPLNLTLTIVGKGNIDDIRVFKLDIKDCFVYSSKPIIKENRYIQKFSIVASKNYTIPSFKLKYFNTTIDSKVIIESKPLDIEVKVDEDLESKDDSYLKYIFLVIGLFLGYILYYIKDKIELNKKDKTIDEVMKNSKNKKVLYKKLLPYSNRYSIDNIMRKLEEIIYRR